MTDTKLTEVLTISVNPSEALYLFQCAESRNTTTSKVIRALIVELLMTPTVQVSTVLDGECRTPKMVAARVSECEARAIQLLAKRQGRTIHSLLRGQILRARTATLGED